MRSIGGGIALGTLLLCSLALGPPAEAVPGLTRVSAASVSDSATTKSQAVACPAGTSVLGGGGAITNAGGQVLLTRSEPDPAANGYVARGYEDEDGYAGNWQVTVYAICGNAPAGLQYISNTGPMQSASVGNYTAATCPFPKLTLGGGGRTNGGNGEVFPHYNLADFEVLIPGDEDANGFAGLWSVTATAVCANQLSGQEWVFAVSPVDSSASKSVTLNCPAGKRIHGVGGNAIENWPAWGSVMLNGITPNAALTSVTATAQEVDEGTANNWRVTTYAVCAP
jgi:hypothetical protein